jgi:hypothetical protein
MFQAVLVSFGNTVLAIVYGIYAPGRIPVTVLALAALFVS